MDIMQQCEIDAIEFYKKNHNLDISTKEKRKHLEKIIKDDILNFLVTQKLRYEIGTL